MMAPRGSRNGLTRRPCVPGLLGAFWLVVVVSMVTPTVAAARAAETPTTRPSDAAFARTVELVALGLVAAIVVVASVLATLIWRRHRQLRGLPVPVAPFRSADDTRGESAVLSARRVVRTRRHPAAPKRRLVEVAASTTVGGASDSDATDTISALIAASDLDLAESRDRTSTPPSPADPPGRSSDAHDEGESRLSSRSGSTDTARLKAKLAGRSRSDSMHEADELKRKLKGANAATPQHEAAPPEEPAAAAIQRDVDNNDAADAKVRRSIDSEQSEVTRLRPVARAAALGVVPAAPPPAAKATRARIAVSRGYVKSEFYAALEAGEGGEGAVVAVSPAFRWRKADAPPSDRCDVAAAHSHLLDTLGADGWRRVGKGDEWFDVRFEQPDDGREAHGKDLD